MQRQSITVLQYELSLNGMMVSYQGAACLTTIWYDAFATCSLLEALAIIEGFDSDGQEPVILYEQELEKPYGWCFWCEFVRTFPFASREAQKVAEYHAKSCEPQVVARNELKQEQLPLKDVSPPLHLYTLHNYYYEHIRTTKHKDTPGAAS